MLAENIELDKISHKNLRFLAFIVEFLFELNDSGGLLVLLDTLEPGVYLKDFKE
jgi:hypothetical protein